MTSTGDESLETADDAASVLAFARSRRRAAEAAEADVFMAAARWASMHAGETVLEDEWEAEVAIAGPGAPDIAEFAVAEFAVAINQSTDSGRRYLGDALETRYRLPRIWARLSDGQVPVWRVRRIAQATISLSMDAAAFVDAQIAHLAAKVGPVVLDRLTEEARVRFDPEDAELRAAEKAEQRHVTIDLDQTGYDGLVGLFALLDLPDALDLEHALQAGAARLAKDGSTQPLQVRRATALGLLARGQGCLDDKGTPTKSGTRRVTVNVHLSEDALLSGLIRVEETRGFALIDQLVGWCADPATQVDVHPIVDDRDHIHVERYEIPTDLQAQTKRQQLTCVFPYCTRPARRCDCDHVVPYALGGATCSCNIAPLCRGHHRLKTHTTWRYTVLEPGSYLWTSPHGYQLHRDHQGTTDVTGHRHRKPTDGCLHTDSPDPPLTPSVVEEGALAPVSKPRTPRLDPAQVRGSFQRQVARFRDRTSSFLNHRHRDRTSSFLNHRRRQEVVVQLSAVGSTTNHGLTQRPKVQSVPAVKSEVSICSTAPRAGL